MERNTILFTGASHTFGLGLEWELDPELNSEDYLNKGVNLPIPRPDFYQKYWRENRWPTLVMNLVINNIMYMIRKTIFKQVEIQLKLFGC